MKRLLARVFGGCDWAIMFILAKHGETYTRLRFNVGPGGEGVLKAEVDYSQEFAGSNLEAWIEEYEANIFTPAASSGFSAWPMAAGEPGIHVSGAFRPWPAIGG